ncbi:MAG: hypothetical protein ACM3PF_12940 [Bacteroidota bacterium]
MLRFLFRVWLALVLFFIGLLFGRRPRSDELSDDPRQRVDSRRGPRFGTRRAIDRSDAVDVPFTEIPPPDETAGPDRAQSARPEPARERAPGLR